MGVAVSSWRLARAVSVGGQLGVVSGTAIERVLTCRLQEGDPGGHIRRALAAFPDQELATAICATWFQEHGLTKPGTYRPVPMFSHKVNEKLQALTVVGAFVEVYLAKEGHTGQVGLNILEKIQPPTLPILYGALLAGVDWVLMGAGIPRDLPGNLDRLAKHEVCVQKITLQDGSHVDLPFDPAHLGLERLTLHRPPCLAIISSDVLAQSLARSGGFAGFVVEGWEAGGHNAPPRGSKGAPPENPVYGDRDRPNLERIRLMGLPFWLAGRRASAAGLMEAEQLGAAGVQVGTAFAFCTESGIENSLRYRALDAIRLGATEVVTEGRASPTGFPFKVLRLSGTEGGRTDGSERVRQRCIMGYLRQPVRNPDGEIIWRCAAEPEADWVRKGGDMAETVGRRCVCQGLMATVGHAQSTPSGDLELPLITAGDDLEVVRTLLGDKADYSAQDVLTYLLEQPQPTAVVPHIG